MNKQKFIQLCFSAIKEYVVLYNIISPEEIDKVIIYARYNYETISSYHGLFQDNKYIYFFECELNTETNKFTIDFYNKLNSVEIEFHEAI